VCTRNITTKKLNSSILLLPNTISSAYHPLIVEPSHIEIIEQDHRNNDALLQPGTSLPIEVTWDKKQSLTSRCTGVHPARLRDDSLHEPDRPHAV